MQMATIPRPDPLVPLGLRAALDPATKFDPAIAPDSRNALDPRSTRDSGAACDSRTVPESHTVLAPRTAAVRHALEFVRCDAAIADLLFLESWEASPTPEVAAVLRIAQIRRANPELA